MMRFSLLGILFVLITVSGAWASEVVFDTGQDRINVTSNFHGEELVVFGSRPGDGEVAVIVEGPRLDTVVRKKGRFFGAWLNKYSRRFDDMPVFYEYAVSSGVVADHSAATALFPAADPEDERAVERYKEGEAFRKALVRIKAMDSLFSSESKAVQFYEGGNLFRADFDIPSNVPVGEYKVRVFYEDGGETIAEAQSFQIRQIGVNASMKQFSQYNSFLYGLVCVILAVSAGWLSDKLRRKA